MQPQYSETYYFDVNADDGVKLWVNGQLSHRPVGSFIVGDRIGSITLAAGVLYDIQAGILPGHRDQDAVHLSWYSNSQSQAGHPRQPALPAK